MSALKIILFFLTLLFVQAPSPARTGLLNPTRGFYVNDAAHVLSPDTERRIIDQNDWLFAQCGAQIVFVTLDTTDDVPLSDYAVTLFNSWGIGSADRDNGALLIMAIDDDDYWLSVGTGLEDCLSEDAIWALFDEYLEPFFAAHDYDQGALVFFDALFDRVAQYEGVADDLQFAG